MKLLDTNIIIYAAKDEYRYLRPLLLAPDVCVSAISKVETLGYHRLVKAEKEYFEHVFDIVPVLPINEPVIDLAILLKQQRKYSLGDSIIAATALLYDAGLNTDNTGDFDSITGIRLFNPLMKI
ncbi:type II toxin-antitoxin system VapC family toxin [Arsenicibacter rosenii]|uniref:PIN domain-containing protein n=1 Tax=Arsenicibacter rosenii TaxID=1750698 RepID=A0A1S2VG16_9BACT|nr:type II toxin-antitoxin system VapC family toxin [Arsenicibacter rosenii]OIN57673.1 hypothetical protein BLX24_18145 [Arsenicibacter rosenii]